MPRICFLAALALTAGCGHKDVAAREDAALTTKPARPGALRFDRREERVVPLAWNVPGITGIAFCPGDRELVTVHETGWLLRWSVADGGNITATSLTAHEPGDIAKHVGLDGEWTSDAPVRADCGPDGSALGVGVIKSVQNGPRGVLYRIDRDGERHASPGSEPVYDARFLPDGTIRLLSANAPLTWNGVALDPMPGMGTASPFAETLGEHGVYVGTTPGSDDSQWSAWVGGEKLPLHWSSQLSRVSVAPDGALLGMVDDDAVMMWPFADGKFGKPVRLVRGGRDIMRIAASDRYFVAATNESVWKWPRDAKLKKTGVGQPCRDKNADHDEIAAMALAHDGHTLAVACRKRGIRLVDLDAAELRVTSKGSSEAASDVMWSSDGKLSVRSDDHILVRGGDGKVTRAYAPSSDPIWWRDHPALPFKPSAIRGIGDTIVFADSPTGAGALRGNELIELPLDRALHLKDFDIAIAPDGSRAALLRGSDAPAQLIVFDLTTREAKEYPVSATTAALTRTDLVIATPDGSLSRPEAVPPPDPKDPWAVAATSVTVAPLVARGARVRALAFSLDGALAAAGDDGRITIYRGTTRLGVLEGHIGPAHALAWSPDGHSLASAGDDGAIVWDLSP